MSSAQAIDRPGSGAGRAAFASLQHREFRWIFVSNSFFFFAMNGQFVVRSILAFELTDSALALGLINLVVAVPMLILSPFGGVIADRMEKKRLIIAGQVVLLLCEVAIFLLLVAGLLAFWHLLVVVFITGACFPLIMPARQAIVRNVVGRAGLPNAVALMMGSMNAARVGGPVLAGTIVAFVGLNWTYLVAVIMYVAALFFMSRLQPAPPEPREEGGSVYGDLIDGFRFVKDDPPIRILMALSIVPIMLAMPFQALLVVFADDVWHVGEFGLGLLQAAAGLGGLLGSVLVAARSGSHNYLRVMMASLLAFTGALFLFALSPWFLLAIPLVFAADVFASVFNTLNGTVIQLLVPDAVRGRVMALMMMTFGLTPLGTLPVSVVAEFWGAPAAVALASVVCGVAGVLFFVFSKALRGIDAAAREALLEEVRGQQSDPEAAPVPIGDAEPLLSAS